MKPMESSAQSQRAANTYSRGIFESLNPFSMLQEAQGMTPQEFLRDFYTRHGLYDKLRDVDALVAIYKTQMHLLYAELDKKYGTTYVQNPPPVFGPNGELPRPVCETPPAVVAAQKPTAKAQIIKVILLGNSGVGKTNVLSRLNKGEFSDEFNSTIGVEFLTHVMKVDGVDVKAQIWDTAGQERYQAMMSTYYRKAIGALLIFDVCDKNSLLGIEKWLDQLLNQAEPGLHAILVGNKADVPAAQRVVTTEEAQQFAVAHHLPYIETSAKTGLNVHEAFFRLISAIHRSRQLELSATESGIVDLSANGAAGADSVAKSSCGTN